VEFDINKIEWETMKGLKDFQKATVDRIDFLYRNGQKRVLVADEVGMGKTLIARGAIAKTARIRLEEQGDIFKVVYICSNQNIANQNIRKLDITGGATIGKVSENRLSMQHLRIMKQEADRKENKDYIQLISLTPETSFRMTGGGSVSERALMYAILKRTSLSYRYLKELEELMVFGGPKAWNNREKWQYECSVRECSAMTHKKYPANVIEKIENYDTIEEIRSMLKRHFYEMRTGRRLTYSHYYVINKLRVMFARISVSMLQPDLVIMDEFQRFQFLLHSNDSSEIGILARSFLHDSDTRILLLSATPYKLYATMEEIEESQIDEHYAEFYQVMDFLFQGKNSDFHNVWRKYSAALSELKAGDTAILDLKQEAENAMYQGVCRTERISVMDTGDYTDDSGVRKHLSITQNDIQSYLQMGKVLKMCGSKYSLPVDYVKSCPYLMSFMHNYKLKENVEKYYRSYPEKVDEVNKRLLWIKRSTIDSYEDLPQTNARLEQLKDAAFLSGAEKYLWIPPSLPYYDLQGVYRDSKGFSKILVFSSWKMVPRMIGSLISYEAERRTIGRLTKQARKLDKKNAHYFAESSRRYPVSRLRFSVTNGEARGMSLFTLLYPSCCLSNLYKPIESLNKKETLAQIEKRIKVKIREMLAAVKKAYGYSEAGRQDERWYYLAPMLFDGKDYAADWIAVITQEMKDDGNKGFLTHIEKLQGYLQDGKLCLGRQPDDLLDTLVNMVLGSPAVCIYRSNGNNMQRATALAKVFVNNFNLTESTAIIDLAYGRCKEDNSHWQNVLKYCKDGCFQAMFDEYMHILGESAGFISKEEKDAFIHSQMMDSLRIHTASYAVDTFSSFRKRMKGESKRNEGIRMRSSYAVGFTEDAGEDAKVVNRKESVRNSFNSPLRPFVLATTSIGQEGLDFHNYCRRIMHWNLPSNPVDLEQREGRINRFKCHAVRQNVALQYGSIAFKKDIWCELFEAAMSERQEGQSELVPYWCFGKNQSVKIERMVPMYPMSKDEVNYERLIKVLSLYRLTMGQARQEELLEYLFEAFSDTSALKDLFINLSPFSKITGNNQAGRA